MKPPDEKSSASEDTDQEQPETPRTVSGTWLGTMVRRNLGRLKAHARRVRRGHPVPPAPGETVDLVQEAAASMLSRKHRARSEWHLFNLFKHVIRRTASDQARARRSLKRGGRRPILSLEEERRSGRECETDEAGLGTQVSERESSDRLNRAYQSLSEPDRRIIRLRLWDEKPWQEVAEKLGISSEDGARMRYKRAIARLRRLLARS
jgi:RNA polymerase sigma factor (sigma-70 family)